MREWLNQSFFFYIFQNLLIKSIFFLLDDLFLFFGFGFLDSDIKRIFFVVIDLKFFFGIKKIVSHQFGDICYKSQFRDFEKRYNDENDDNDNSHKYSQRLGSWFGESIECSQSKSHSHRKDKHLYDIDTQRTDIKGHTGKQSFFDILGIDDFHRQ